MLILALEVKNRDFFQLFTGLREETFYTYQGQVDRIRNAMKLREADNATYSSFV